MPVKTQQAKNILVSCYSNELTPPKSMLCHAQLMSVGLRKYETALY